MELRWPGASSGCSPASAILGAVVSKAKFVVVVAVAAPFTWVLEIRMVLHRASAASNEGTDSYSHKKGANQGDRLGYKRTSEPVAYPLVMDARDHCKYAQLGIRREPIRKVAYSGGRVGARVCTSRSVTQFESKILCYLQSHNIQYWTINSKNSKPLFLDTCHRVSANS